MRSRASLSLFATAAVLLATACTPSTPYRYTALIPAARPLAWDGRTAKEGSLRLEGTLSGNVVHQNEFPVVHDTAVHVPNVSAEGLAAIAVTHGFELGVRYSYAAYGWSSRSASGTMPLPREPSVWGVGPEVHGSIPLDRRKRWAIGIGGNLMRYEIPYAEWVRDESCITSPNCVTDLATISNARYRLHDEGTEAHYTFNIGVYPSVNLGDRGEYGRIFGGFSTHSTFKNDGFATEASNGSTLQDAGLLFFVGAGYSIQLDPIHVGTMFALPLFGANSDVRYAWTGFLTLGVDIELWESRETREAKEDRKARPE